MQRWGIALAALIILSGAAASALSLSFPANSELAYQRNAGKDRYDIPISPLRDGELPTIPATGEVSRQVWQIASPGLTTQQLLDPLRQQLTDAGFTEIFSCDTESCGGFDFRFRIDVVDPPAMYVDLRNYRFASYKSADSNQLVSLLVSSNRRVGYIQLSSVAASKGAATINGNKSTQSAKPTVGTGATGPLPSGESTDFGTDGRRVLTDLTFETGSANLGEGPFTSLAELAELLGTYPTRRLALVGHTDATGSAEVNTAISQKRAEAVRRRLIERYGIDGGRLEAHGVAYYAPLASNATEAGREINRRVEAVLLGVE